MQLRLDAADRLVELVEERRGPVAADEAARAVLKLGGPVATGLARSLLDEAVRADARLRWAGDLVALASSRADGLLLEHATFVVFDLETTGLRPGVARPCEFGAVRVERLEPTATFQSLANPGARLQPAVAALTGLRDEQLRRAPPVPAVVRRFLAFAGDAVLVAHNARFDMAFLDNETMRLTGKRVAASVVDTVGLARRLLGRQPAHLASLAYRFATDARPCHRALPDAEATAEILLCLLGMAQERGARTVADVIELAATKPRRVHMKRSLAFGAPQRPAVEAALAALDRIEWRVTGSELEAALEELRLIRALRPPANARSARPDRYAYLRRRGDSVVCSSQPGPFGPLKSRGRAQLAARALQGVEWETPADALPKLKAKLARLARDLRYEDAARLRDRVAALEHALRELAHVDRLRALEVCVFAPALDEGWRKAFFVARGQVVCARPVAPCDAVSQAFGGPEIAAGLAAVERAEPTLAPEAADELLVVGQFLRRPPPELEIVPLAHLRRWRSSATGRAA